VSDDSDITINREPTTDTIRDKTNTAALPGVILSTTDKNGSVPPLVSGSSDGSQAPNKRPLPHWCVYIAWTLVALSVAASAFFTILYAFSWGGAKSTAWLVAFLLSFIESVILIQPIKVSVMLNQPIKVSVIII
jgi:hypothetical protein